MSNNYFKPYNDDTSTFSALSMNEPLSAFDEALSYMKNCIITIDGDAITDSITGAFSFTGKMRFLFTSPTTCTLVENLVESTEYTLMASDALYADLNPVGGTTITLSKQNLNAGSNFILKKNRFLVAFRNPVSGEIYLANTLHKITNGGGQTMDRVVTLVEGVTPTAGQVLCLTSAGVYALADNAQLETTLDLVMVKTPGSGKATVIESGLVTVTTTFLVGAPIYLGTGGNFTQVSPTESGKIVKCIGWAVSENVLKFKPDSFGIKLV